MRWDPYCLIRDAEFASFWEKQLKDRTRKVLLVMGRGCQSASKRDPLSACNRDPLLGFVMDVTSAPLARVGA